MAATTVVAKGTLANAAHDLFAKMVGGVPWEEKQKAKPKHFTLCARTSSRVGTVTGGTANSFQAGNISSMLSASQRLRLKRRFSA